MAFSCASADRQSFEAVEANVITATMALEPVDEIRAAIAAERYDDEPQAAE